MALRLYLDAACTQEIDELNPDIIHKAVVAGADMIDERSLWIKSDDPALTYENTTIAAQNKPANVTVQYAKDSSGSPGAYADSRALTNGTFEPAVRIWRKVMAASVQEAFKATTIKHSLGWDEYVR